MVILSATNAELKNPKGDGVRERKTVRVIGGEKKHEIRRSIQPLFING